MPLKIKNNFPIDFEYEDIIIVNGSLPISRVLLQAQVLNTQYYDIYTCRTIDDRNLSMMHLKGVKEVESLSSRVKDLLFERIKSNLYLGCPKQLQTFVQLGVANILGPEVYLIMHPLMGEYWESIDKSNWAIAQKCEVAMQIIKAVAMLHDRGFAHGHLHGYNLCYDARHGVSLCNVDFHCLTPFYRAREGHFPEHEDMSAEYTWAYRGPEYFDQKERGKALGIPLVSSGVTFNPFVGVNQKSDVWSLGVLLFECFSGGIAPFGHDHFICKKPPTPPKCIRDFCPDIPKKWQFIIGKCLTPYAGTKLFRAKRFKTASEIEKQLH